ncbi:MAG TPA: CHAT domain-containing protein, partial [Nitrospira sp.]
SLSCLLLANSPSDSGILYADTIARAHLEHSPVVFISACATAVATPGSGTGRTIAAAFLHAGARAVIGTLWDIEDNGTHEIASAFHNALQNGLEPVAALRRAQLKVIAGTARGTCRWAAFQVYMR